MPKTPTRKLKVFQTQFGFFDTVLAAPSQAAALRAWGTHRICLRRNTQRWRRTRRRFPPPWSTRGSAAARRGIERVLRARADPKKMGGRRPLRLAGERGWLLARLAEKPYLTLRADALLIVKRRFGLG